MAATHRMPTHHPRIIATRHMVSSANWLAAQAGFEILEAGGNAIDAGGIALGALQCEYVHFAGDRMGHRVNWWREWEWHAGCVCAIVKGEVTGMMEGGADVRRPGGVRGW